MDSKGHLSAIRNAARDVARNMARFERDMDRFQKALAAASADGVPSHQQTRAVNEAVAGNPTLTHEMRRLVDVLQERAG